MDSRILSYKLDLIQWLSSLEDESIIKKLLDFRKKETEDWWNQLSNEEQESIEKGIEQANKKELGSHSEARKVYEKWL